MSQNLFQNPDAIAAANGADYFAVDFNGPPTNNSGLTAGSYFELKLVVNFDGTYGEFSQEDNFTNPANVFNPMGITQYGAGQINNGSYTTEYFINPFLNADSTYLDLGYYFNSDYNSVGNTSLSIDNLRVIPPGWNTSGAGNWNIYTNWTTKDSGAAPNFQGLEADFLNYVTSNTTVTVSETTNIGTILFNDAAFSYTIMATGSGNLTMNMPGTEPALIDDRAGTHTISAPLILATNTVVSGATTNVYNTSLCVNVVNSGDVLHITGAISGAGGLYVNDSSTLGLSDSGAGGTLAAPTIGIGATTNGFGTVSLESANTYGGGTTVAGGTLIANVTGALPNGEGLVNNGTTDIYGNETLGAGGVSALSGTGTLNIGNGTHNVVELAVGSGGATQGGLTIAANSSLDIGDNHIILNDPSGGIDATIRAYLAAGYNNGNWNGTSATAGTIITSAATGTKYGIGYADGADGGISGISSGQLEVKYTLYGDANLDGSVNSIDFGDMAANFGKSGKVWDQGDFNYDGTVNSIDFGLLAGNFGKSVGGNADVTSADWAALDAFAAANGLMADVPEPATTALLLVPAITLAVRRRRRSS